MGIVSSIASAFGHDPLKDAEKKARKEIQRGQADALGYYEPYQGLTQNALLGLTNATGLGDSDAAIAAFKDSPLYRLNYEAMLRAGADGVNARAQAGGMNNSGRTLLQLQEDAGNTTNQLYSQWMNPLADLTQTGIGIAGNKANIRTGAATQIADSRRNTGAIKAGNLAGWDQLVNTGVNALGAMATGGGSAAISGARGMYF